MRIKDIRALEGPNLFHDLPVMVMYLDLEDLTERESHTLPGFNGRLLSRLPGLAQHHCSRGHAGGFIERLEEGTYVGHVVEHVALELAGLLGSPVTYGKTRYAGEPGLYQVIVRYRSGGAMRSLLHSAVELVQAAIDDAPFPILEHLHTARQAAADTDLGPSTGSIVAAAQRRGIPWRRLNDANLVQLGYGRNRHLIQAAVTDDTNHIAMDIASDKALTKSLLHDAGIPVPAGEAVTTLEAALAAFDDLGAPVVVKPLDGNQGRGVTLAVQTPVALELAYERASRVSRHVLVERHLAGNDYRILVVDGKFVAASRREPCSVTGDGASTVRDLIYQANADPDRGEGHEKPLTKITIDDELLEQLDASGLDLDSVPLAGTCVTLRANANLSTGGTAVDVTDMAGTDVIERCQDAARLIGLDVCGIDLVTSDISAPIDGGIVEVNAGPGLRMHLYPAKGTARDVGGAIVDMLYPPGAPSRVPICAITGTNGKTTVTRMIGHVLGAHATVGMTTTDGIHVAGRRVSRGDHTGPTSARTVLADPSVTMAVLETARGGILRRGLGYDWSDVAVITNITRDHIGQDGIETLDDVIWIKSLVAERVRDGGTLVLNADDPGAASLATDDRVMRGGATTFNGRGAISAAAYGVGAMDDASASRLNLVYVALTPSNPLVQRHLAAGGTAFYVDDGQMIEARGNTESALLELVDVPATLGGTAAYQVANCLAAAAAARAMGLSMEEVAVGLASFDPDRHNPGRSTIFGLGAGHVMVDYGHNPEAFRATGRLLASWPGERIGIVGVPGDRNDDSVVDAARAAAEAYPRLLLREDDDLRGRRPGEVTGMMLDAVRAADPSVAVEVVDDALTALQGLLPEVAAGAFVIIYYEHLEPVVALLTEAGAEPTALPAGLVGARAPRARGGSPRRPVPGSAPEPRRLASDARYSAAPSSSSERR